MNITWDADGYKDSFGFVPAYGAAVLDLLTVPARSLVVDLGCGNGALTAALAERGYRPLGVDDSPAMLARARADHPDLRFEQANALSLSLSSLGEPQADAIFSNAVFHWIDERDQPRLLRQVASQLRPGGELVCEFGGLGCGQAVHDALAELFAAEGLVYRMPWYFPSVGQYAPLVEATGLRVTYATLFDRPTPQVGEHGLAAWIRMFDRKPFEGLEPALADKIIARAEQRLAPELRASDGTWYVDYVRIRLRAVRR